MLAKMIRTQLAGIRPWCGMRNGTSSRYTCSTPKEVLPATEKDFSKIEIRVGSIVECILVPQLVKLYLETIDLGGRKLSIGSKLAKLIPATEMVSGRVLIVTNMKPRKLAGIVSEGMILAASNPTTTKLLRVPTETKLGTRVYLEGQVATNNNEEVLNPKKDILQRCLANISIDSKGIARFCGRRLIVGEAAEVSCQLPGATVS